MPVELRDVLLPVVRSLRDQQLQNGDIPCMRTTGDGFYTPCNLLTTLVHDALAYFDPNSWLYEPGIFDLLSTYDRQWLVPITKTMRWRLRAFVAWQEDSNGTWKLYGRESNAGPDVATTACAAVVMLRTFPAKTPHVIRHVAPVKNLLHQSLTLYEKANLLRFLSLAGQDVTNWTANFGTELKSLSSPKTGSETLYFLSIAHAIARGWRQAALPDYEKIADDLLPQILALQFADGSFGQQLETALAACALLDLSCPISILCKTAAALVKFFDASGRWNTQPYWQLQAGSVTVTMALAMTALARIGAITGGTFH